LLSSIPSHRRLSLADINAMAIDVVECVVAESRQYLQHEDGRVLSYTRCNRGPVLAALLPISGPYSAGV
jgi:hypothetical protein